MQQRVAGSDQKNETKKIPLQFLGENETGIKKTIESQGLMPNPSNLTLAN